MENNNITIPKYIGATLFGIFVLLLIQTGLQITSFLQSERIVEATSSSVPPIKINPDLPVTEIRFDSLSHNFGVIPDNHKVYTQFGFTNTGKEPLMILSAEGSCGCTVPTWPKEAIAPGKQGMIEVSFDPNGKINEVSKIVTITANSAPTATILTIKATVIKSD